MTDIDYIKILKYLEKYSGISYKNPENKGITNEEKNRLLLIKKESQEAVSEMKKIAEQCQKVYSLYKFSNISWLDGSNTKIKKYLWLQMKYEKYKDIPISVSISIERNYSQIKYYVSLEIKDNKSIGTLTEKYHLHLDISKKDNMQYVTGNNELGNFRILTENNLEIKEKIKLGKLKKVKICICIEGDIESKNDYYNKEIMEAVKEIIPYYEYVIHKI